MSNREHIQNIVHKELFLHYRNAVYQGSVNDRERRQGYGLLYLSDEHHLICSTNFYNGKINGYSLFFNDDSMCMYGNWKHNLPHGLNVVRLKETIIFAQYDYGKLKSEKPIFMIFERYNIGIIVIVESEKENDEQSDNISEPKFKLIDKYDMYSTEQLVECLKKCQFQTEDLVAYLSAIKFISLKLTGNELNPDKPTRIRLINNSYYRFGYDHGIAIIFDDDYCRLSVGIHNKSKLSSLGVKYTNEHLKGVIEEGIFDETNNTILISKKELRPKAKIGKIYSRYHLSSTNFQNEFYINPSKKHIEYFQRILEKKGLKPFIAGFIAMSRRAEGESLLSKESNSDNDEEYSEEDSLECEKSSKQLTTTKKRQLNSSKESYDPNYDLLADQERLKRIRDEIEESLKVRNFDDPHPDKPKQEEDSADESLSEFNIESKNSKLPKATLQDIAKNTFAPIKLSTEESKPNLKKDSLIKLQRVEEIDNLNRLFTQNKDKELQSEHFNMILTPKRSKSRRKIFDSERDNIRRGYSPDIVSPFKQRMRSIFGKGKDHRTPSPAPKQENKQYMITNVDAKVQTYNSPHLQLDLSKHHDENSAFMPITVIGHANIGQANLSQANIQRTDSQLNIKPEQSQHPISQPLASEPLASQHPTSQNPTSQHPEPETKDIKQTTNKRYCFDTKYKKNEELLIPKSQHQRSNEIYLQKYNPTTLTYEPISYQYSNNKSPYLQELEQLNKEMHKSKSIIETQLIRSENNRIALTTTSNNNDNFYVNVNTNQPTATPTPKTIEQSSPLKNIRNYLRATNDVYSSPSRPRSHFQS